MTEFLLAGAVAKIMRGGRRKLQHVEVRISKCVHFCGFQYGVEVYHPYESYARELHAGVPIAEVRQRLVDFLRFYRPRHMGEALGVNLERRYPLWVFPWTNARRADIGENVGWHENPNTSPDILTHFSEAGIPLFRITEEFFWLERAYYRMAGEGYNPYEHASFVRALQLIRKDGEIRYLLLDGNHRVSALAALGETVLTVEIVTGDTVAEDMLDAWPLVRRGVYLKEDALKIFDAYFGTNQQFRTTGVPARILNSVTSW